MEKCTPGKLQSFPTVSKCRKQGVSQQQARHGDGLHNRELRVGIPTGSWKESGVKTAFFPGAWYFIISLYQLQPGKTFRGCFEDGEDMNSSMT